MGVRARQAAKSLLSGLRVRAMGPHADAILCTSGHARILVPSRDFTIGRKLAFSGSYEPQQLEKLLSVVAELRVKKVLIVGAHVGYFVLHLAKAVDEIVALEPNPRTFELLTFNVRINDTHNAQLHPFAATSSERPVAFVAERENTGNSRISTAEQDTSGRSIRVEGRPVDCLGYEPDLLVLDVEGHEVDALRGMSRTLVSVRAMQVELLPELLDAAGSSVAMLVAELARHFTEFEVDSGPPESMSAEELLAWAEGLRGDERRVSRNVLALNPKLGSVP